MQQIVIAGQYKLIKELIQGKHSQIYYCVSLKSGKQFAVKIQDRKYSALLREASMLTSIQKEHNILMDYGLPICYHTQHLQNNTVVVETLLGSNLQHLLAKCKGMLRINTFLMIADQMLKRLEFIHRKQYIHRALTLGKWAIGLGQSSKKIYLLGFGKAKHYIKNGQHIPYAESKSIINEVAYASINSHLGLEPSRRDDLQSMLYCWVKMLYGKLPWQGEKDIENMLSKKIEQRSEVLFANFPQPLVEIGRHIQQLTFVEDPDYQKMRNWMLELFEHYELEYSYRYDWQQIDEDGNFK